MNSELGPVCKDWFVTDMVALLNGSHLWFSGLNPEPCPVSGLSGVPLGPG